MAKTFKDRQVERAARKTEIEKDVKPHGRPEPQIETWLDAGFVPDYGDTVYHRRMTTLTRGARRTRAMVEREFLND